MTGYEALHSEVAWIDLSGRGKLRVTGEDRARLLHAMCTNHVQGLVELEGLYAFFLTSQGRIVADANIYNLGDSIFLDTEPDVAEKLREHLDKYIIADDAVIEDESTLWAELSVEGPASIERASELGIPVPENKYGIQKWERGFAVRVGSATPDGVRLFLTPERKHSLIQQFESTRLLCASAESARIVQLENGIPRYGEDISERYLVQETGVLHAVHTNKGCYLGQEIVERVRSRAQVHRVLKPIRIQTDKPPVAGTKLVSEGKEVAEITSAAYSPSLGEVVGLAYVRTEAALSRPKLFVGGSEPAVSAYLA